MRTLLLVLCCCTSVFVFGQVKIGGTGSPHANATLELDGGTNRGFLMPRLTNTQMNSIGPFPPDGLMVYNTTDNNVYIRRGGFWRRIPDPGGAGISIPFDDTYALPNTHLLSLENSSGVAGYSVFRGLTTAGNGVSGSATNGNGVNGSAVTGYGGYFSASGVNGVGGYFTSSAGPSLVTNAGNVGIGVPVPQFILDVNGRMQLRHNGNTAGMWLQRSDNTAASFIGQLNDSTFGIYDAVDNDWKITFNHSNTNIGLGSTTPKYPLVFANTLGDKISLFNGSISNTTNHYGLGIQGSLLQMFTPTSGDDIAFGTGRSGAFTERFRFTGDGFLGVGTSIPTYPITLTANGNGFVHKSGVVEVGTYNNGSSAFIQTYSNHPLHFSTNNGVPQLTITTAGEVGVGTSIPQARLHVAGGFRVNNGTEGIGKVLTSDNQGNGTWKKMAGYGFHAKLSANIPGTGGYTLGSIKFDQVVYNDGSPYNPATGNYVIPESGFYHFEASVSVGFNPTPTAFVGIILAVNGTTLASNGTNGQTIEFPEFHLVINTYFNAGDIINVTTNIAAAAQISSNTTTHFSGFKVY